MRLDNHLAYAFYLALPVVALGPDLVIYNTGAEADFKVCQLLCNGLCVKTISEVMQQLSLHWTESIWLRGRHGRVGSYYY